MFLFFFISKKLSRSAVHLSIFLWFIVTEHRNKQACSDDVNFYWKVWNDDVVKKKKYRCDADVGENGKVNTKVNQQWFDSFVFYLISIVVVVFFMPLQNPLSQLKDLGELQDQLEDLQKRMEDEIQAGIPPVGSNLLS